MNGLLQTFAGAVGLQEVGATTVGQATDVTELADGLAGESWLTAAITMDNPYCSCKLTRVSAGAGACAAGGSSGGSEAAAAARIAELEGELEYTRSRAVVDLERNLHRVEARYYKAREDLAAREEQCSSLQQKLREHTRSRQSELGDTEQGKRNLFKAETSEQKLLAEKKALLREREQLIKASADKTETIRRRDEELQECAKRMVGP